MNLNKLFEAQKELDEWINKNKGLEGKDLLLMKILALQVEIGELANEWRGFKFWSIRQTPEVEQEVCTYCGEEVDHTRPTPFMADIPASMCKVCWDMTKTEYAASNGEYIPNFEDYPHFPKKVPQKMLEEYVDCLHFILSIGNDTGFIPLACQISFNVEVVANFNDMFISISYFSIDRSQDNYAHLFARFISLGVLLGFKEEQVEQAYFDKNKKNHNRQENGY